jgi:hypothetical protein
MDDVESLSTEELEENNSRLRESLNAGHVCIESVAIRLRTFNGGHVHHVQQCIVCGCQSGGPLNKAKATEQLAGTPAQAFDDTIEHAYRLTKLNLLNQLTSANKEISKRLDPVGFAMDTDEIQKTAQRKQAAVQALEIAVEAVGQILPWREILPFMVERTPALAAKFKEEAKDFERFTSEAELKVWIEDLIAADFDVFKEVSGVHLTECVEVKIDYVLKPKPHLIDSGFLPGPVGLEVKYLRQEERFSSRASRFVWQAVSYTDCKFNLPDGPARLSRVLLFSNMSFEDEYSLLKGLAPSVYENEKAKWTALLELANHANVGNLMMYGSREKRLGWKIKFAAGVYFSRFGDKCELGNAQLFNKIRIGNF